MSARTLADAWDEELVAMPLDVTEEQVQALRRAFFRGALATLGMPPEQLRAELIAHGRSVGSAAEKAPRVDDRAVALMRSARARAGEQPPQDATHEPLPKRGRGKGNNRSRK